MDRRIREARRGTLRRLTDPGAGAGEPAVFEVPRAPSARARYEISVTSPPAHIRPATLRDVPAMQAVEESACELFPPALATFFRQRPTPEQVFAECIDEGAAWVAEVDGAIVGQALAGAVDGAGHLHQVDVRPAFGRRGIGRALVEEVCAWATRAGRRAVTLTTMRDVPWNAPFYARLGFRELDPTELGPELAALRASEDDAGLPPVRVAMRRIVAGASST